MNLPHGSPMMSLTGTQSPKIAVQLGHTCAQAKVHSLAALCWFKVLLTSIDSTSSICWHVYPHSSQAV